MPSIAIQTDASESVNASAKNALTNEVRNLNLTVEIQAFDNDKLKSRYQRWRGIAHKMENEIHAVNELNKSYATLYFNVVKREDRLRAEIQQLSAKNTELQAVLRTTQSTKAPAVPQTPTHKYQTQNHFSLHRPLVMDAAASATPDQHHQQHSVPATHSSGRPGQK
jgi:hypothetical protein